MVKIEKALIRPTIDEWLDIVRDEDIFASWDGANMTNPQQNTINLKKMYEWIKTHNIDSKDVVSDMFRSLVFSEEDKAKYDGRLNPRTGERNLELNEAYKRNFVIPLSSTDPRFQEWINEEGAEMAYILSTWDNIIYKMGFDSREHFEIFSYIMGNPEYTDIGITLDPMYTIERITYNRQRQETGESTEEFMILDRDAPAGLPFSDSNPPESIKAKLYDFNNSSFENVLIATSSSGVINPLTQKEDLYLQNFIPKSTVLAKYSGTGTLQQKLDNASIYIIREEQIMELYDKINKNFGRSYSHKQNTLSDFLSTRISNFGRDDVTFVEPNLEPMKNVFKIDQDFRNQIYERFDNKGAKKVLEILQYELRLQGRKTREGRGSGKSDVETSKALAFNIQGITNYRLHVKDSVETLYFITFLQAARGDRIFDYYEGQIIFPNESNAANFMNYSIDNWLKISPNVVRRTKQDILAYLDFIQSTYRTKKMIWDEIPANIKTSITQNIKEIIERSLYGNLTMRTRRGAGGMRVTKNVLKSIVQFKQTAELVMTNEFGGIKRFKDLNKEELQKFINNFSPNDISIDDTSTDIKFKYVLTTNNYSVGGRAGDKITQKEKYLRNKADASMKFAIMASGRDSAEMGLLLITFNYDENDKMDKIEATSFTLTREALEWRPSDTVITSSKEISLEYPFDEIGVYMREIMTGPNTFTWRLQIYEGAPQQRGFEFSMERLDPTTNRALGINPLWSNMKANPIRGEVVGYAVGRGLNGGYQFVMPDSTLTAAGEAGQLCLGRIYIKYYDKDSRNQITIATMEGFIEDETFTLENIKNDFIIAAYSDYRGACIKLDRDRVRNDTLGHLNDSNVGRANYPSPMMMQAITRGHAGDIGPDGKPMGQNLDQEIENPSRMGREADNIPGAQGFAMNSQDYVQQLKLFRRFGKPFFDFIDRKIIEALNNGTLKYGAKSVRVGTTDTEGYYIGLDDSYVTVIHEPPADVEEGDDENE